MKVPFNKNSLGGNEFDYIKQAAANNYLQGDGQFSKKCHELLQQLCGTNCALLTCSCTLSLEMAAILAGIKPDDEVILPSFTFVSTASAFALRGAKLVWCDVDSSTMNMNADLLENLITEKTKAIVPVHYAGAACDMDKICAVAKKHNIMVIEDAAQAMLSYYDKKPLGTFGPLGSVSFHGTKNIVCGEGGAILVNDQKYEDKAYIIREKGTNRRKFLKGEIDKYTWVDLGSSYLPSEINAAFLLSQLEHAKELTQKRVQKWDIYAKELSPLEKSGKIKIGKILPKAEHNAHIFYFLTESEKVADSLMKHLKENGIAACSHYAPLHMSPMGEKFSARGRQSLPVTEKAYNSLVRLPIYADLDADSQQYVCEKVFDFWK